MTINEPCADKEIIQRFITEITKDWHQFTEQVGVFELRCLAKNRTPITQIFTLDAVGEAVDLAVRMNTTKLNVYMTINPINPNAMISAGKGATNTDILRAHYSFADADDQQGLDGLIRLSTSQPPDITVITGTVPHERQHAYWGLAEPCYDLQLWQSKQEQIANQFKTDPSVKNSSRIMRVAGTVSYPDPAKQKRHYVPELVTMTVRDD
jgi:hypothetical protein